MQVFSIAVKSQYSCLSDKVKEDLALINNNDISISIDIKNTLGWEIIECNVGEDCLRQEEHHHILRRQLAAVLANFIVEELPVPLITQMLERHYQYLSNDEKSKVLQKVRQKIKSAEWYTYALQQKADIVRNIGDFLRQDSHVNIQGFVNFRLKIFMQELKKQLDLSVQNYLAEKEHEEFIELLRFLVNMQPPLYESLHVFAARPRGFLLMDEEMNRINIDGMEKDLTWEELLLTGVISSSPRSVVIHKGVKEKFPRSIEMLQQVFADRFSFCGSCSICGDSRDDQHLVWFDKQ